MKKLLEIKNLVTNFYTYEGKVKALNGISLEVENGTTFGLVGESGCGKSITVRSVMRIVPPPGYVEGGEVLLHLDDDGKGNKKTIDLLKQSEPFMRNLRGNQISMIFQEPNAALNPVLSIGDQISESFLFHQKKEMAECALRDLDGPDSTVPAIFRSYVRNMCQTALINPDSGWLKFMSRIPFLSRWDRPLKREALKRCEKILKQLSIPNPERILESYPHNLSGGMKQRIVIAIALACNPVLLIADEATSNLDVTIQAQILELLSELKKEVISSILLITHDLGVIAETCDRVGVMYAGTVCEIADVDDLFSNPKHPYTAALLNSVPKFAQEGKLESIEGNVPNLIHPPDGCRFHPRCPQAMDVCRQKRPEMYNVHDRHQVECHLYGEHAPKTN